MAEGARRVAIACQGGGSHTAFTAGVLGRLLGADALGRYEIVGLSGTSGGAVCALLAWTAVADGDPGRATELLQGIWADNAATSAPERMMNAATLWMSTMANFATMPAVSPYDSPVAALGLDTFRRMLRRRVDFRRLAPSPDPSRPILVIGDRRNELSGNLSLYQELHVIEKIDELLNEGLLASDGRYRPIMVRVIELPRDRLSSVY